MTNKSNISRLNMIKYIKTWEVSDSQVLNVMENISREKFFPKEISNFSYADAMVPIGHGQVSLEPKMIGRILQSLEIKQSDIVLEIGTGTGYLTTLLSKLAKEVYTIEVIPEIASKASNIFKKQGANNIFTKVGNGLDGWGKEKLFDAIVVTGSLSSTPNFLLDHLRANGKMFATIGSHPVMRATVFSRQKNSLSEVTIFDTNIPRMIENVPASSNTKN